MNCGRLRNVRRCFLMKFFSFLMKFSPQMSAADARRSLIKLLKIFARRRNHFTASSFFAIMLLSSPLRTSAKYDDSAESSLTTINWRLTYFFHKLNITWRIPDDENFFIKFYGESWGGEAEEVKLSSTNWWFMNNSCQFNFSVFSQFFAETSRKLSVSGGSFKLALKLKTSWSCRIAQEGSWKL